MLNKAGYYSFGHCKTPTAKYAEVDIEWNTYNIPKKIDKRKLY